MRHDRLALVVHGVALAAVVAIAVYLFFAVRAAPPAPAAAPLDRDGIARAFNDLVASFRGAPKAKPAPVATPAGRLIPEAGRTYRYEVKVEPPVWRDITLTYRTVQVGKALEVRGDFRHAEGGMAFNLGVLAPRHASHASVRFPGFFMHVAYLEFPLKQGQAVAWEWPWQLPDRKVRADRIKRYRGTVAGWENVGVPAGVYAAVRIDAQLEYVEAGRVQAAAKETLWIAPKIRQVVKVQREGRAPDEPAQRIVAELAEFK